MIVSSCCPDVSILSIGAFCCNSFGGKTLAESVDSCELCIKVYALLHNRDTMQILSYIVYE